MDERQITNPAKETEEKGAGKQMLLENALVEMRNALSVSFAASSVLSDILKDKKEKKLLVYLAMVKHNQYKLLKLTQNIENLAAFERDRLHLEPEPTNISRLCRDIAGTVSALLPEVSFGFRCFHENTVIMADGLKLENMLLNLISACVGNMPEGGRIDMVLNKSPGYVIITLLCTGDNIIPLQPYDNPVEYENAGIIPTHYSGVIGMAAARSIARLHSGRIFSSFGAKEGILYSVALPDRPPDDAEIARGGIHAPDPMSRILTGLSDILDYTHYMEPFDES